MGASWASPLALLLTPRSSSPKRLHGQYHVKDVKHGTIIINVDGDGDDISPRESGESGRSLGDNITTPTASRQVVPSLRIITMTLRQVLDNSKLRAELQRHLAQERCDESVAFVSAVYELTSKGLTAQEQQERAAKIVERFISDHGESQILLTPECKEGLLRLYDEKNMEELTRSFAPALCEVFIDLKLSSGFRSFMESHAENGSIIFTF